VSSVQALPETCWVTYGPGRTACVTGSHYFGSPHDPESGFAYSGFAGANSYEPQANPMLTRSLGP
jgi:hypothetical protein